jgi:hypothetical protein
MELTKIKTETVSEKTTYSSASENFKYEISVTTGIGANQILVIVKRNDVQVANINDWSNTQSNINFTTDLTSEEKIEIVTSFNDLKSQF